MSRGGHNKSNLIGLRFGRLIVLREAGRTKCQKVLWYCVCDCGGAATPTTGSLQSGNTQSCGCLHKERQKLPNMKSRLANGEAAINVLYSQYRCTAKRRGYKFGLTKKQFKKLTSSNCYYCGIKPAQVVKTKNDTTGRYTFNGIDRVDSAKGYIMNNCVSCCKICNVAKHNLSQKQFYGWIKRAYNHILGDK